MVDPKRPADPAAPRLAIACGPNDPPAAAAAAVTKASASNLHAVGRFLPGPKRRLFEASYAGMRVIDDYIDDGFLALEAAGRARHRTRAVITVESWRRRSLAALDGGDWRSVDPEQAAADPLLQAGAEPLYDALAAAVERAPAPPAAAWTLLARSMIEDAQERALISWEDFLHYCEGATVAPAAIFLHVLTARAAPTLSEDALFEAARPMALFCYLVHILRDLRKDAARGGQLLTLPEEILAVHGLARETTAAAIDAETPEASALAADLAGRAGVYRAETQRVREALSGGLGARERAVLGALIAVYERLHDRLEGAPSRAVAGDSTLGEGVREGVFARYALDAEEGEDAETEER
ncbi:MAG: squalene/phytoene synthase family protein [Nitratireductor sp.]